MKNEECRVKSENGRNNVPGILHSQFCVLHLNPVGLLFPVNHAPLKLASLTALNLFSLQPCQQTPNGYFAPNNLRVLMASIRVSP
jgi:hypothetical protein